MAWNRPAVSQEGILSPENTDKEISRRRAIGFLAAAGAGVLLGCGGGTKTTATTTTTSTSTANTSCTVTPEGEEGPYFVDDSATGFARSDIRSNLDGSNTQSGIPLTLSIYVYDSQNSCAAMANVQVDIWHCNASGIYSAEDVESTVGETWLRGYQLTDSNGLVTFVTIVPGWYQGRTTHIHLRLRSTYDSTTSGGTNTTQLFFPQDTIDTINTTISPYSTEGTNPTTNASDHVYAGEVSGATLLTP
jgi:protocatechuate 3,4-dioxygenase beta subunit